MTWFTENGSQNTDGDVKTLQKFEEYHYQKYNFNFRLVSSM